MPRLRSWTDSQFVDAAATAVSVRGLLRALGLHPTGANYKSMYGAAARLGVDFSHFKGQRYLLGQTHRFANPAPLDQVLVENSSYHDLYYLKKRLVEARLMRPQCYICDLIQWLGEPISLVLDHINGRNDDHRIENLRFLCPNCNSQQDTFAGRNKALRHPGHDVRRRKRREVKAFTIT